MPEVSIIIPVYNVEPYLRQCLESVLTQTFKDYEVVLVDDGSTDGCGKICDEYAEKDARIRVVHQENAGLSGARNKGIENACGNYLYFLDSDDWIDENTLEKLHHEISAPKCSFVACGYYVESIDQQIIIPENVTLTANSEDVMLLYARKKLSYAVWNKMYRRDIVTTNNVLFYGGEKYVEDHAFNLKYLLFSEKAAVIQTPLYHYRIREGQITAESPEKRLPTYVEDTKKLIKDFKTYGKFNEYQEVLAVHFATRFNEYLGGCAKSKLVSKRRKLLLVKEIRNLYRETGFPQRPKHKPFSRKERMFLILLGQRNAGVLFEFYRIYALLRRMMDLWENTKCGLREKIRGLVLHRCFWLKRQYLRYTKKDKKPERLSHLDEKSRAKPRLFLIGTPEYNNVGDQAIAVAEKQYLNRVFPDYLSVEITESEAVLYFRNLKKCICPTDIILLQGGGNMGSEYPDQEMIRKHIIKAFPDNKIVVFPQTIFVLDEPMNRTKLKLMRNYYSGNKDILLCARERRSYEIMLKSFNGCKVALMPDIAFQLQSFVETSERNATLICLRSDKESALSREDKAAINNICRHRFNRVLEIDTCVDERVDKENREIILNRIINQFKSAKLIVTDRLHGMILSAVTKTPCVVFSNSNHKIINSFEWIKDIGFIRLCDNLESLEDSVSAVLSCAAKYDPTAFDEYYNIIKVFIQENLNGQN